MFLFSDQKYISRFYNYTRMAKETGEMIREMLIMMLSRKENDNAKDGMYVNIMLKILNEYKFSTNCKTKTK